jgi:sodium/bile acid cotransporter 7
MASDAEKRPVVVHTETVSPFESSTPQLDHSKDGEAATSTSTEAPPKKKPFAMRVIRFMQDQWFLITLAILIAISSQHQVPKEHQKLKSTVVTYLCVSGKIFLLYSLVRIH